MNSIERFVERIKAITASDLATGHSADDLFRSIIEEIGEYAAAKAVSVGVKDKLLLESARDEAVDVVICALGLFYAEGGTDDELSLIGNKKLNKWSDNMSKRNQRLF